MGNLLEDNWDHGADEAYRGPDFEPAPPGGRRPKLRGPAVTVVVVVVVLAAGAAAVRFRPSVGNDGTSVVALESRLAPPESTAVASSTGSGSIGVDGTTTAASGTSSSTSSVASSASTPDTTGGAETTHGSSTALPSSTRSTTTLSSTSTSTSSTNTSSTDTSSTDTSTTATTASSTALTTTASTSVSSTEPARSGDGSCASGAEFERVFRDDFNGSAVAGHWSQFNSTGNAGYGLRRPSANSVSNGRLIITAAMRNGSLESGGMAHGHAQTYGKYRFRVRTDNDPDRALSGVVLTWPQSGVHPRDGENNIYETLVQTANRNPFFTFIHKPFGSTSDQEYIAHQADGSQWQVMTMEWTPSRITIIREGQGSSSYSRHDIPETSADLIPDVPHRLHIQLDAWNHSVSAPVRMEVDWVEVYRYCS